MKSFPFVGLAAFVIVLTLGYVSHQREAARDALAASGHPRADLHASLLVFCVKGRVGWVWSDGQSRGKVCTGGLLPARVTVQNQG